MNKPNKTLKDFRRLEKLLAKQAARTAKLLARRKTGDAELPTTAPFYARIAERHAAALADVSEIAKRIEALGLEIVSMEEAKAAKKAADKAPRKAEAPKKPAPAKGGAADESAAPKAAAPAKAPAAARRAPRAAAKSASA